MCAAAQLPTVVEEILRSNADRKWKLVRLKLARMDDGPFAFFRGTNHLFARAWAEVRPPDVGPSILICGDLHLENFGAYETEEGDFRFDINDFDDALVGPCSLDLVRCSTSILLAAEEWQLTPVTASGMVLAFLDQYRAAVIQGKPGEIAPRSGEGPIWELLGATALGTRAERLERYTKLSRDGTRKIRWRRGRQPLISAARAAVLREAVERYGETIGKAKVYRVHDVRGRIAGVGSLGLRRYTVLIEGGGSPERNRLLDVKEERPPALLACTPEPQPDFGGTEAQRIVEAQRRLQAKPCAGLDVLDVATETMRMREMVPDEDHSSLERLREKPSKLRAAVEVAGRITAWSHLRGATIAADRATELIAWASGSALDAVLVSAVRFADRARADYREFHRARFTGLKPSHAADAASGIVDVRPEG
jgi:uncharacterized protein (DUF2252 family)